MGFEMTDLARGKREGSAVHRSFIPELWAPSAAREALEDLRGSVDDDVLERCRLVVTELVSNSVRHAGLDLGQRIDLDVLRFPRFLRMEVADEGCGFSLEAWSTEAIQPGGGWGLSLVDRLADRWGMDSGHGTIVWSEFDGNLTIGPSGA
jgi:anti-sigma regulatory factor (Ser/Thr protein kinase)